MRIIINQAAIDDHHERLGLLRLSAPTFTSEAQSLESVAQLVRRLGVPFAAVATLAKSAVDRAPASDDSVCGQCVVRLALA